MPNVSEDGYVMIDGVEFPENTIFCPYCGNVLGYGDEARAVQCCGEVHGGTAEELGLRSGW